MLDLERKAFVELCAERKTLERIQSLLQTGKILKLIMMKSVYIVGGYRSAVGKSGRGMFRFTRPDELKQVLEHLLKDFENLDKERIDDVIVGNATPEAEQGLNMARMISLMGLDTKKVPYDH